MRLDHRLKLMLDSETLLLNLQVKVVHALGHAFKLTQLRHWDLQTLDLLTQVFCCDLQPEFLCDVYNLLY